MPTKTWYRSLAELESTPEFLELMHREFPKAASEFPTGFSRRRWLQLMGASLVFGGSVGCRFEQETLAPFATRPANRIPGKPKYFNTTFEIAGVPQALRVTNFDGRPIKLDGNPDHVSSGGASTSFAQATALELYDPDRARTPVQKQDRDSKARTWLEVDTYLSDLAKGWETSRGAELAILGEPTSSPTVERLRNDLLARFPEARWFEYGAVSDANVLEGAKLAYAEALRPHYNLTSARVIVALDCDLLGAHADALRLTREYANGRSPQDGKMVRLYAIESEFTQTGTAADHRLAIKSSLIGEILASVEAGLKGEASAAPTEAAGYAESFVAALIDDLRHHEGESLIAVGPSQPPAVHALAHRINEQLKNVGKTVWFTRIAAPEKAGTLADFVAHAAAGKTKALLILGGNPVYAAPADLDVAKSLSGIADRFHLTLSPNETSVHCNWVLPRSHQLESWSDCRLTDGTYGIGQPQIAPLFESCSEVEFLSRVLDGNKDGLAVVRQTAVGTASRLKVDKEWNRAVHDGYVAETAFARITPELKSFDATAAGDSWKAAAEVKNGELELNFSSSSSIFDGRFANNAWLQELPHPLTKLTWGNAAVMSPQTASTLHVKDHDVVTLEIKGRQIELPVYILPGQATGTVSVAIGYGRTRAGLVGGDSENSIPAVGVNVSPLRTSDALYIAQGLKVNATGRVEKLAATQDHYSIDKIGLEGIHGRIGDLIREASLDEYLHHPDFAQHKVHHPPLESPWTEHSYDGHAWGMAIDLNKCIGCNACAIACQSENNVPVVGAEQVRQNREMHWLRIDRYFAGDPEQPQVATQPVTCHHCENAPCEQVCPVAATVHSDEGLNDMAYNRCIGTRYCGNNCPYKVRRFNFLDYRGELPGTNNDLSHLVLNPEVTVRTRGVMEKCTYCVQRIQNTRITARNEGRPIGANEVQTACQQACAAQAIVFGDLNNPESNVAKAHNDSRAYAMLSELNIKPRTKYLARIRNPHPWLAARSETHPQNHPAPTHTMNLKDHRCGQEVHV
ncbi:TAT-variant-translocated molybdopterin oxidoreductase [Schlesneria sp. DSM 10557]|uniref:TAT-variant-translocated molybdopterin oxidoreductase n=1 Tax=Schlesneria sp. DSM 10557 TaxID=3044399 RepID=UPI0035A10241